MKKAKVKDDEMRTEYTRADLGPLVRGKYAAPYAKATNIVVIEPALTKAFPNNEAVNDALRTLLAVGHRRYPYNWSLKPDSAQARCVVSTLNG